MTSSPRLPARLASATSATVFCDDSKAAATLGFRAQTDFDEGLAELAGWVASQTADDRVHQARAELEAKGLVG